MPKGTAPDDTSLATAATLLRSITDTAAISIFLCDERGRVTFMNPEAEKTFGFTFEELRGTVLHDRIHHRYPDGRRYRRGECPLGRIYKTGETVRNHEDVFFRKDGSPIPVACSNAPVVTDGIVTGTVLTVQDISARVEAERKLRSSHDQLKFVTDSLQLLIAECDDAARYRFANRAYAQRFGYEPQDLLGRTVDSVIGKEAYEAIRPYVERVLAGERLTFEVEVPYADLGLRTMRCEYVPHLLPSGKVDSFVASILDITAHRRAEAALRERESQFRAAFELSAVGQAMIDANRRYLLANDRYCEMTGYTREELLRMRPEDLTHPDDIARDVEIVGALMRGDVAASTSEKRYIRKNGEVIWVRVHGTLFTGAFGTPLGAFAMIEDITDEKRAAEQREALFARERAARLAAEEANRTKDEFLATLSHELRTPLNAILGWTQMLRQQVIKPERIHAALEAVDRNARKQAQLVDDLLDLSRITAGRLRLRVQRVPIVPVIEAATETIRPAVDAKQITLTLDTACARDAEVDGDPIRLQQILWNLLSNAVKFTPEGGHVRIAAAASGEHVSILIKDTGIGIEPSFVPRLFARFEQGDRSTTRTFDGLGLGLAIVRHLAELHGGSVRAESSGPGCGATFTVILPARRSQRT